MRRLTRRLVRRVTQYRPSPTEQRRIAGTVGVTAIAGALYWAFLTSGLPVFWGPSASAAEVAEGRELFEHEWTPNDPLAHGDGLGPVFNAKSCVACHFQGGVGGGGRTEHNAVAFEVTPLRGDTNFRTGTIHNFSVDPGKRETPGMVHSLFPIVRGSTSVSGTPGCQSITVIPDFDPVRVETVQPTALFGAGWLDLISDKAILKNARLRGVQIAARELSLNFDGVPVGRVRTVAGGVGKFGWKAQFATLEEFVSAACANELGLGTPTVEQAKPLTASEAAAVPPDLDRRQVRALASFVKTLPKPVEAEPDRQPDREATARGKELFGSIGCATCHVPDMGGVSGVYSDFLLYVLEDPQPAGGGSYGSPPPQIRAAARPEDDPRPEEWKTPPLWGVADSAPYLHDGSAATLKDAVLRHKGDARTVTAKYKALNPADQAAVIAFLGTLKAPPDAPPLRDPSVTRLVRR